MKRRRREGPAAHAVDGAGTAGPRDDIGDLLARATRAGRDATFDIPVNGSSLAPLVVPGDIARVRPCSATSLRRGDLALIRQPGGWTVRLITATAPLRTAALRDSARVERGAVAGRIVAVVRGPDSRVWGMAARLRGLLLHRLLTGRVGDALRRLRRRVPRFRALAALQARRAGPVQVRLLAGDDAGAADDYATRHLPRLRGTIARQLRQRWPDDGFALGAFDRRGRMAGFVFVDEYRQEGADLPGVWVRGLSVHRAVRGAGIGRALLAAALAEAGTRGIPVLYADVLTENPRSLALFASLGFRDADATLASRVNALLRGPGDPHRTVLLLRLTSWP